ncbi:alpha/beta fold hydrolase [Herpetosiphon giganteus]|uniref:alpha/beta fold hydrolase n=1 Tax=Herpetosiphon giganteus TaxID=2029754 RepID=UPI001959E9FD|nr:alpha/beta hydrolase [Herpetosiphon giganteus]MBM7844353.1 pimeloyl-ACP methyl ester carboxylesterase [Herpetosiphon giganteus]
MLVKSGYAPINDLQLYYEIHGSGQPLILVHGGLGGIGMFTDLLPALAEHVQVIAVELQGHARTNDIPRAFSYSALADDVADLIAYLGLSQVDIAGFSFGGGVALQTAIRHQHLVRKLIIISAPFRDTGWYPAVQAAIRQLDERVAAAMVESIPYKFYQEYAPNPANWPQLVRKTGAMGNQSYDWSSDIAKLQSPCLLIQGDADSIPPSHAVEFFALLGGAQSDDPQQRSQSQLAILPNTNHFDIIDRVDLLLPIINPFLAG